MEKLEAETKRKKDNAEKKEADRLVRMEELEMKKVERVLKDLERKDFLDT